jgi:hypothetical protein
MTNDTAKRLATQLACQLPDKPADQQLVLMYLHELMEWLHARPKPVANVVPLRNPTA